MTPLAAKNARIVLGAQALPGSEWEIEPECDWPDTTTFEDGGDETQVAACRKCTGTMTLVWDGESNPHDNPPNIVAGQSIGPLLLFVTNEGNAPFWEFANASVLGTPTTANVKGIVQLRVRFKANGEFNEPQGDAF